MPVANSLEMNQNSRNPSAVVNLCPEADDPLRRDAVTGARRAS